MHIQHNESTSGHTGNISIAPPLPIMKFHHQRKHVSFWFWKKLNFLHFLPCKEILSCMFYLEIINCNEFHSDLISLFEKLYKNIEIGNNEWHRAPFGEIETEPRNLRI